MKKKTLKEFASVKLISDLLQEESKIAPIFF